MDAGVQGGGSSRLRYRATAAVMPAKGIVAASVDLVGHQRLRLERSEVAFERC